MSFEKEISEIKEAVEETITNIQNFDKLINNVLDGMTEEVLKEAQRLKITDKQIERIFNFVACLILQRGVNQKVQLDPDIFDCITFYWQKKRVVG